MSEQRFGWNYFENEVVIGDKQDKKRMIVVVFSNFMCIPYNRKSFDELVDWLNEQQATIRKLQDLCGESDGENMKLRIENKRLQKEVNLLRPTNLEQYEQIQKLQEENEQLRAKLREKEQDEQLYANEIVKLNKEAKEVLDFKSLGGDY